MGDPQTSSLIGSIKKILTSHVASVCCFSFNEGSTAFFRLEKGGGGKEGGLRFFSGWKGGGGSSAKT